MSKLQLMKNQNSFSLIDGAFSPIETRELLFSIFKSKIRFHRLKNFSSQERFGKDDEKALDRMLQLKETLVSISKVLEAAEKEDKIVEIKAEIILKYSANQKR